MKQRSFSVSNNSNQSKWHWIEFQKAIILKTRTISHTINGIFFKSASQKICFQDWVSASMTFWKSQFCLFSSPISPHSSEIPQLRIFKSGSSAELSDLTPSSLAVLQILSESHHLFFFFFAFHSAALAALSRCLFASSTFSSPRSFSPVVFSLWESCIKVTGSWPFIYKCTSVSYKVAATAGWGSV